MSGAEIDVLAMAAVRATREATVNQNGDTLPVIVGTPLKGEVIDGEVFDGETETAIFPGDLPHNVQAIFDQPELSPHDRAHEAPIRFVRFRPPAIKADLDGIHLSLPHIRLDRAMQFLLGDRLA